MEKLKGYTGILVAIFFCLLLLPTGERLRSSTALRMTPFDDTLVILATLRHGDRWQFVETVASFLRDCDNANSPKPPIASSFGEKTNSTPCILLFDIVRPNIVAASLPYTFDDADEEKYWNQYVEYIKKRSTLGYEKYREALKPEIKALHQALGEAIVKHANSVKGELTLQIYLICTSTLIVIALMIVFRRKVGGAVLFPITFFTKQLFKTTKTTAKKIHDKI